jgi:hypothetical protein
MQYNTIASSLVYYFKIFIHILSKKVRNPQLAIHQYYLHNSEGKRIITFRHEGSHSPFFW